jgi:hypothetical protein
VGPTSTPKPTPTPKPTATPKPTPTECPTRTPSPTPVAGDEGCTPGYWKQWHHYDSWVGYAPSDDYATVFGVTPSFTATLGQAVAFGSGGEKALARHAVAALLNAASPGVSYAYGTAEVIDLVRWAYSTGEFEAVKDSLAAENETSCPLS